MSDDMICEDCEQQVTSSFCGYVELVKVSVKLCPKHAATADLLAALKFSLMWLDSVCDPDSQMATEEGLQARVFIEGEIAKAEIH